MDQLLCSYRRSPQSSWCSVDRWQGSRSPKQRSKPKQTRATCCCIAQSISSDDFLLWLDRGGTEVGRWQELRLERAIIPRPLSENRRIDLRQRSGQAHYSQALHSHTDSRLERDLAAVHTLSSSARPRTIYHEFMVFNSL